MAPQLEQLPAGPSSAGSGDAPFWEALRDERLVLPRCAECRQWRPIGFLTCSQCWSFDTSWDEVEPLGTVYSWIRTHRNFMSELDVEAPYITVLVELDGAPVRLLGILVDADEIGIGDQVRGVFQKPDNSDWTILRWSVAA